MEVYSYIKDILWLVFAIMAIINLMSLVRYIGRIINSKILLKRDIELYNSDYSEEKIMNHLDYLITECLDYYFATRIIPKDIYYINTTIESEIRDYLVDKVSERISPALQVQLSLVYNIDKLPEILGERLNNILINYIINFNLEHDDSVKNMVDNKKNNN